MKPAEPTTGRYLHCGHTVVPLRQSAIGSPHRIPSIQGDMGDPAGRLSDSVRGNATPHDRPHDTGDKNSMLNVYNSNG